MSTRRALRDLKITRVPFKSSNPLSSDQSKNFDVLDHFLRELVGDGNSWFEYICSEEHANVLTKDLPRVGFECDKDAIMNIK